MKPQEKLARAVFERYGMLPMWPVDHRIAVGDVISRTAAGIRRETTLDELVGNDAPLAITEDIKVQKIKISDGVKFESSANTTVNAGVVDGTVGIGFGSRASFVILVEGGGLTTYDELWAVRKRMLSLHSEGSWDSSWQLVTSVRSADACTFLVSDKAGVKAVARLRPGILTGDLLDVLNVGSEVVWSTDGGLESVGEGCTPLHSVLRVRRGIRTRTVDGLKISSGAESPEDDVEIDVVGPEEAGLADEIEDEPLS
jgi:hypothetical protein